MFYKNKDFSCKKNISKLINKDIFENIIFTKTEKIALDKNISRRNNTSLVFGGEGSGKTHSFILPNLMQMNGNFIIFNQGDILKYKHILEKHGYNIKILDCRDKHLSYNPFKLIKTEEDVDKLVKIILEEETDNFYKSLSIIFLKFIINYVLEHGLESEKNFAMVENILLLDLDCLQLLLKDNEYFKIINNTTCSEKIHNYVVSLILKKISELILLEKNNLLKEVFDLSNDELSGLSKTSIFIIPKEYTQSNLLEKIILNQLLSLISSTKNTNFKFLLDDFNQMYIYDIEKVMFNIISNNIFFSITTKNSSIANRIFILFDNILYLKSYNSAFYYDFLKFLIIDIDYIHSLKYNECILFIEGLKPFKSKKYDFKIHTNYIERSSV